jgi:hypothetical protein
MTLNKTEAENILNRVFASDLAGAKVEIMDDTQGAGAPTGMVTITFESLRRTLKHMTAANQKIEAIKLYREAVPGTGLADAKSFVENL